VDGEQTTFATNFIIGTSETLHRWSNRSHLGMAASSSSRNGHLVLFPGLQKINRTVSRKSFWASYDGDVCLIQTKKRAQPNLKRIKGGSLGGRRLTACAEGTSMNAKQYRRIYVECLKMADVSNAPKERLRWWAIAMTCLKRANELDDE
jgi:hypothetical protein